MHASHIRDDHARVPADGLGRRVLANLDLLVLVPAVILALALGAPTFGVLVGAGAWLLQRVVAVVDQRAIRRAAEPGSRLGLNFIDAFARIWLLVGGIVVAGAVGEPRGRPRGGARDPRRLLDRLRGADRQGAGGRSRLMSAVAEPHRSPAPGRAPPGPERRPPRNRA